MSAVQVRQAVLDDLNVLASLFDAYRQFYGRESDEGLAREFLRARFSHGESVLLLATDCVGQGLGFVQMYPSFSSVSVARVFILNDLYVTQAARRRGVGGALLEAAATYAKKARAIRVTLSTAVDNAAAQSLYRKHGWEPDQNFSVFHRVK